MKSEYGDWITLTQNSSCQGLIFQSPNGAKAVQLTIDLLNRDIVDTVASNGNVWKMLLGSINKNYDDDNDDEESDDEGGHFLR